MIALIAALIAGPWTWSVYESASTVTLAHEAPDTNMLGPVLECARGSGQVKVTVNVGAGPDRFSAILPARDPAFQGFVATGKMTVSDPTRAAIVTAPIKVARFAKLCGP
jgi:hypothetical protein